MDKRIEIRAIHGAETIPYLHWFENVPERKRVDSESVESIVVNIMNRQYHGLLGLLNGEAIGLLIYEMVTDQHVNFKLLYGPKKMSRFYMALMEYLNQYRITSFEFESVHEPKLWSRLYPDRIKKKRSTYTFDVAGLFTSKSEAKRLAVQNGG